MCIICLDRDEFAEIKAKIMELETKRDLEYNREKPDIEIIRAFDNKIRELILEIQ